MVYRPTRNLPITQETTLKNARRWLGYIRYGESGTVIQLQDDCEYRAVEIINNPLLLRQVLGPYYRKYLLKYLSLEGQSVEELLKNALLSLIKDRCLAINKKNLSVNELLDFIASKGYEVGLFIGRATPWLQTKALLELELILQKSKNFSVILFIEKNPLYLKYQPLVDKCSLLFDNLDFYSLYSEADSRQFINYQSELWDIKIKQDLIKKIIDLSGGYLWLIAACLRFFRDNPGGDFAAVVKDSAFLAKLGVIWNKINPAEKQTLAALNSKSSLEYEFLAKIGLIRQNQLGLPALKLMIDQEKQTSKIKAVSGKIFLDDKEITRELTQEEKIFFNFLLAKKRQIIDREQLAQRLWGKLWEEKYSDWALDRLAFRLRHKLQLLGIDPGLLKTRKKKGFIWG